VNTQVLWYSARAAGIVAWALATASIVWGLALSSRALGRKPRPGWLLDLHRFLGAMALIFTAVHVLSVLFDTYVHFGVVDVLVPLTGTWHPVAVAWGIVGLYALLTVELTSLARSRLPRLLWRRAHYASFAVFVLTPERSSSR
jgi:sulfoxide reductase heme-binding subunit YedZ